MIKDEKIAAMVRLDMKKLVENILLMEKITNHIVIIEAKMGLRDGRVVTLKIEQEA